MYRTVVLVSRDDEWVNMNDEYELDALSDYTRKQYLEDLASTGLTVTAVVGNVHMFSDGSLQVIKERSEPIDLSELDEESRDLLLSNVAQGMLQELPAVPPQCFAAAACC